MVYGLFLQMDQTKWYRADFSATNKLTGTIYSDINMGTAKDTTGYVITIRLYKGNRWGDHFDKVATAVTEADGTWEYAVGQNEMPPPDVYNVKIELSKSGDRESTINRQELLIIEGPTS